MLDSLYIAKSKIRRDLLALFFTNPKEKYYLRQLWRLLGYSAGSIRRELLRLREDNLLNTSNTGNLVYYSLNSNHPLFKEIKSIVAKTVGVEGSIKKALAALKNIKAAFIYGSFAAAKENLSSDIDLMIIGDPDISILNEKIAGLEKKLKREINPTVYSWRQYRAKRKVKSGFILDLLNSPKIILIGGEDDL